LSTVSQISLSHNLALLIQGHTLRLNSTLLHLLDAGRVTDAGRTAVSLSCRSRLHLAVR
jgi:hypothetical protein